MTVGNFIELYGIGRDIGSSSGFDSISGADLQIVYALAIVKLIVKD